MVSHFYYHPRMTHYDFGPRHPLKPERLRRTVAILEALVPDLELIDPGLAEVGDLTRVHSQDYVLAVEWLSSGDHLPNGMKYTYGFGSLDNPAFPDMFDAARAYCGGAVKAARAIMDGAPLAFNIAGGLHHAMRAKATGFCVFNDCAIAIHILREKYQRVAYIDIDLHHGDGVEALFVDDPSVLTYSIHQDGRTIFPGTGSVYSDGQSIVNCPLPPHTTGDVWVAAFERTCLPAMERFQPEVIVLQMGTDPHTLDPIGHLDVVAQEWIQAVRQVGSLGVPILASGGGGYRLTTVPRMWAAAVLELSGLEYEDTLPSSIPQDWDMARMFDTFLPSPRSRHSLEADVVVDIFTHAVLPTIPRA